MDQKDFGKFISKLRKEKKLTQEELGERLGVNSRTISRWENGNYMPDISLFEDIGKELDVSVLELLKCKRIDKDNYLEESNKETVELIIKERKEKKKLIICLFCFLIILLLLGCFSLYQVYYKNDTKEDTMRCCNFYDGIYTNDIGTKMNEEEYDIIMSLYYDSVNIKKITREEIELIVNAYYSNLESYNWYGEVVFLEKVDMKDDVNIVKRVSGRKPFIRGKYDVKDDKKYCALGSSKYGTYIISEYRDNKCIIDEDICERLNSEGATVKVDVSKYCEK